MSVNRGEAVIRDMLERRLEQGSTALGLWINDVYMVDLAAHMGFDWFMIDQMFTPTDWSQADQLMRAGEAAGITPVLRIQSNPWLGYNRHLAHDLTRALGIGFQYVLVSHSGKREIEDCAEVAKDWHRKALWVHPFGSIDEWSSVTDGMMKRTHVIPHAESEASLQELDETLAIPGIDFAFVAMTDASKVLNGGSAVPDFYNRQLWKLIDQAVSVAKTRSAVIGANTSYAYDLGEMARRVLMLSQHGVKMVMLQGAGFLFQVAIGGFLRDVRAQIDG